MYFPYGVGHIHKRTRLSGKPKPKLKPKKLPTSKVQIPAVQGFNWCRWWSFGASVVILIWAIGTLCYDDPVPKFVAPVCGLVGIFYMLASMWIWLWDWDRRDRGMYDDPPRQYYDVY